MHHATIQTDPLAPLVILSWRGQPHALKANAGLLVVHVDFEPLTMPLGLFPETVGRDQAMPNAFEHFRCLLVR